VAQKDGDVLITALPKFMILFFKNEKKHSSFYQIDFLDTIYCVLGSCPGSHLLSRVTMCTRDH